VCGCINKAPLMHKNAPLVYLIAAQDLHQ